MAGRFQEAVALELAHAEGRALVVLPEQKPTGPLDHLSGLRANFLAQLIATRDRLPQTTALRRETPDVAVAVYARHSAANGASVGSRLI